MSTAASDPKSSDVYRKIAIRLGNFRPTIQLNDKTAKNLSAGPTVLDGLTFVPSDWRDLVTTLRIAKTLDGQPAFAEGKSPEKPSHWALDASMAATIGKGFREIWRPKLSDRPLSLDDLPGRHRPKWNIGSSARFGDDPSKSLDLSSLHFAVAPDRCNVHIDQTGFILIGPTGELVVDPDFAQHLVNELLWKTKGTNLFPLVGGPDWNYAAKQFQRFLAFRNQWRCVEAEELQSNGNRFVLDTRRFRVRGDCWCKWPIRRAVA